MTHSPDDIRAYTEFMTLVIELTAVIVTAQQGLWRIKLIVTFSLACLADGLIRIGLIVSLPRKRLWKS